MVSNLTRELRREIIIKQFYHYKIYIFNYWRFHADQQLVQNERI